MIQKAIVDALLDARKPLGRSELAGRAGVTIKRLSGPLALLVEQGHVVREVREAGRLKGEVEMPTTQVVYRLPPLRLV